MNAFDSFVIVDWSGGNDRGAAPKKDAIWSCIARDGVIDEPLYHRNRQKAEAWLNTIIESELFAGRRLFLGFDFPFGYPTGFCQTITGTDCPLALWDWVEARIEDYPKTNNRFDLAAEINLSLGGDGPFWGNALKRDVVGLARTKHGYRNSFAERRMVERQAKGSFTCWQLAGAGSVGSQVLMGLPVLSRLRRRFGADVAVWPFEPLAAPVALAEVWPGLINPIIKPMEQAGELRDAAQVSMLAKGLSRLHPDLMAQMLKISAPEEGWIFGLGYEDTLMHSATKKLDPPPLKDDCFALPSGTHWTPVDEALSTIQERLRPAVAQEQVPLMQALGRVLAGDVLAQRANPPLPNTAVDGYGLRCAETVSGSQTVPLVRGRSAAGAPFDGPLPPGHAVRVLTGAALPEGVDTVILQEDVSTDGRAIAFNGPLKVGANTRRAGEDVDKGDLIFRRGQRMTPPDLALAAATGSKNLQVFHRLRVAVLSTGDELCEPGDVAREDQIFDANRPMLLGLIRNFGFEPIDMGQAPDDRTALADLLDKAALKSDLIMTSGGASSGDEDHLSALLSETGAMALWRIAIKPGRPLALGVWQGKPVFGLPGNPVAALVCALVFARPAMGLLAGEGWRIPKGLSVPAAFSKFKKSGRREFLRARLRDGKAEVYASEGSGRIRGLSWAEGLVELPDSAMEITPGTTVKFYPYSAFVD
ncbi:molybdenum cofactor synthesis domain-containing protein [Pseudopelagicola sp. nBUS_19]|uniref:molybdenum cofactor synthesis domain-containing protein n=1 Tax=unclassified Pseudopelagicola TaxID=2649563 RepID=UPI003EBB1F8D